MEKLEQLKKWIEKEGRVIVAFSGGIDSALLVVVAHQVLKDNMLAVTGDSESVPSRDREFVGKFCSTRGIPHTFIKTREFDIPEFRRNPENRCYYCKGELYKTLSDYANKNGFEAVLDGTNASDLSGHRPGYRAIQEIEKAKTPYVDLGITKDDIRAISDFLKIEIAHKPASACLSSRIPWGMRLDPQDLEMVDQAENFLRDIGIEQVRVRHHDRLARLQCLETDIPKIISSRKKITDGLKKIGYDMVTFDLKCYGE